MTENIELPETFAIGEPVRSSTFAKSKQLTDQELQQRKPKTVRQVLACKDPALISIYDAAHAIKEVDEMFKVHIQNETLDSHTKYVHDAFDAIKFKNSANFELVHDTVTIPQKSFGKDPIKTPGSENFARFEITEGSEICDTFTSKDSEVFKSLDSVKNTSYGTIAERVNFDVLNELRESVYHAKFELDKVTGVKDSHLKSLEEDIDKAAEVIQFERRRLLLDSLSNVISNLKELDVSDKSPEERKLMWDAIKELEVARGLVNKAGFKDLCDFNEQEIKSRILGAIILYPELDKDPAIRAIKEFILRVK